MNKAGKGATALRAFAILLTALAAGAQRLNGTGEIDRESELLLVARSKQQAGEYNIARDTLLKALSKTPDSAVLLDALGSVEQDLREYLAAERSYLHALSASTQGDPERVAVLQNLATLYLDTGQYSKCERIREQLEKLEWRPGEFENHPAEAAALLNVIGSLEHARRREDQAERYYSRSMMLFRQAHGPISVDAALVEANLAFLRLEARQYESAADLFRQAIHEIEIASGPENQALIRPLVNLAACESMAGHANEAEVIARRAVELSKAFGKTQPVTATAMLVRATALRRLGRKRLARDLEKRAKAYLRNNPTTNLSGYTVSLRDLAGATFR